MVAVPDDLGAIVQQVADRRLGRRTGVKQTVLGMPMKWMAKMLKLKLQKKTLIKLLIRSIRDGRQCCHGCRSDPFALWASAVVMVLLLCCCW